ncbi:MAG: hypothetical protein AMXMBFR59_06850 [Rhodanobacteraceae bacterium]
MLSRYDNTPATVPVPVTLTTLSPLGQQLILRLLLQHTESADGCVRLSPRVMRAYGWWDPWKLARARRECEQRGFVARVQPHRNGTSARYRLAWLPTAANGGGPL